MSIQARRAAARLQPITQGGGNPLALPVWMHIQPIQVAIPADIAKADDLVLFLSYQRIVTEKGAVPGRQIGMSVRPGVQLLGSIVTGVDGMNRLTEQTGHLRTVQGTIFAQFQDGSPFLKGNDKKIPWGPAEPQGAVQSGNSEFMVKGDQPLTSTGLTPTFLPSS